MLDKDIRALLALHRSPNISNSVLRRLLFATQKPSDIYQLSASELNDQQIPPAAQHSLCQSPDEHQLELDYSTLQQQNIQLLPLNSVEYPELLKEISDPPPLLYVRGDVTVLNRPQLAMVGSRHASIQGRENAYRFARELSLQGFTITSGLALGIDTESHRGALTEGSTIAVLGTGVDVIYPSRNHLLAEKILDQGALISEFPLRAGPRRSQFPKRNRLISGMSLGVLVVEAALQSGSLITARCALEQNREVFAIPGSIHGMGSRGCHAMIREGAKLVESAADITEELQGWLPIQGRAEGSHRLQLQPVELSDQERMLLDLIGFDPASVDLLAQRSGWSMSELMSLLTALELKGVLESKAGSYLQITGPGSDHLV